MNAMLSTYGIPIAIAVIAAVIGHVHGKSTAGKSAPSTPSTPTTPKLAGIVNKIPGLAKTATDDPVVQLVFSKILEQARASGHAALDAAVVKLLPGLAPAIPMINQVVDGIENKVAPVKPQGQ